MQKPVIPALSMMLGAFVATDGSAQAALFDSEGAASQAVTLQTAFSCPLGQLAELYAGLAEATDALDLLAVETEVLTICRTRQERLRAIADAELELRELFGIENPAGGAARISIMDAGSSHAPLIVSCPKPDTGLQASDAPGDGQGQEILPEAEPEPQAELVAMPAHPPGMSSAPVSELLSALLTGLAVKPASNPASGCGSWSWAWTGRDSRRSHAAVLVSPDGHRREVAIGDRLPAGLSVYGISTGGVTLEDRSGELIRLPPSSSAGPAVAPPAAAGLPEQEFLPADREGEVSR